MEEKIELGKKIKHIRVDYALSQSQFAEKIGASQYQISNWETGQSFVQTKYLLKICQVFDLGMEYFNLKNNLLQKV